MDHSGEEWSSAEPRDTFDPAEPLTPRGRFTILSRLGTDPHECFKPGGRRAPPGFVFARPVESVAHMLVPETSWLCSPNRVWVEKGVPHSHRPVRIPISKNGWICMYEFSSVLVHEGMDEKSGFLRRRNLPPPPEHARLDSDPGSSLGSE